MRHSKKNKIVIASIGLYCTSLVSTTAFAIDPSNTLNEQQYNWQESLNQQRLDTLVNANTQQMKQESKLAQNVTADSTIGQKDCLPFTQIQLTGMASLSASAADVLNSQARRLQSAPCISVAAANQLTRQITQAYVDEGYFKVNIQPKPTFSDQIAKWHIYPAKVVAIDGQLDLPTKRLFGDIIGKPANIAWLDQAVSNAERVIDGQLILDIYPVGDDVRIALTQQGEIDPISADIEWYYDPDDSYGHHKIRLHSTLRNVIGQADFTSINFEQGLTDNYGYDKDNQQRSASIYTVIPSGRWQLSALLAGSENDRVTVLPNSELIQTGDSWQANVRGEYTLSRDQDSITTAYGQLAHTEVSSEVLGSQLDIQSPTISSAKVGMTHTQLLTPQSSRGGTGAVVVDLSAEKAFGNHDNPATKAGLSDDYLRWLFTGYFTHSHRLESAKSLQFTHELQAQYSDDVMFGINKQSLGSRYSGVRGLANQYNSADKGVSLRNTASLSVPIDSWLTLGQQRLYWSPYIGADFGVIKDNTLSTDANVNPDTHSEKAGSATAGIKLTGYDVSANNIAKSWDLDISASRPWVDYYQPSNKESSESDKGRWKDTEVMASWRWFF